MDRDDIINNCRESFNTLKYILEIKLGERLKDIEYKNLQFVAQQQLDQLQVKYYKVAI